MAVVYFFATGLNHNKVSLIIGQEPSRKGLVVTPSKNGLTQRINSDSSTPRFPLFFLARFTALSPLRIWTGFRGGLSTKYMIHQAQRA